MPVDVTAPTLEVHDLAKCCWCGGPFVRGLVSVLGLTPWTCATERCWRRQVAHAMIVTLKGRPRLDAPVSGNRRCRFVPLPRQVEAMDLIAQPDGPTYVLIGGAAGGSKSKGVREIGHSCCLQTPRFRVLLLRRTYKELDQTHLRDVELEAPELGAEAVPSAKVLR